MEEEENIDTIGGENDSSLSEGNVESFFFAKKAMDDKLADKQKEIDKKDIANAFDNILMSIQINKLTEKIAVMEEKLRAREATTPMYGPSTEISIQDQSFEPDIETPTDWHDGVENSSFLVQVDAKSTSGSYPPVIRTIDLRTDAGHKNDVTMFGAEGAWASKTRVPTLPKDANGAGDLTWVEQQSVTVIVDIQFDTSSGYIQVKTQDLTVLAKSAISAWTNKIQAFPCATETVSGQMSVNGVTRDVTVLGAANP